MIVDDEIQRWVIQMANSSAVFLMGLQETAMPAFRSKLSEEKRWYVITFIRSTFTPTDK